MTAGTETHAPIDMTARFRSGVHREVFQLLDDGSYHRDDGVRPCWCEVSGEHPQAMRWFPGVPVARFGAP